MRLTNPEPGGLGAVLALLALVATRSNRGQVIQLKKE